MKQAIREKYHSETNTTHKTAMRQGSMRVYKDKLIELRDMVEKHKTKTKHGVAQHGETCCSIDILVAYMPSNDAPQF